MKTYEEELRAENQRLWDLARHQRSELLAAGLLTFDEYDALAADTPARSRLETYDALRARLKAAESAERAFHCVATVIQGAYVNGQLPRPPYAELADLIIAEYSSKRAEQYEASSRASVAESVNETLRDWIKAANQFAWAHERHCPRHDSEAACTCGLDSFLSRRRPFIEPYKEELAAARAEAYEQGKRADAAEALLRTIDDFLASREMAAKSGADYVAALNDLVGMEVSQAIAAAYASPQPENRK